MLLFSDIKLVNNITINKVNRKGLIMEDKRALQLEALEVLYGYNQKLINAITQVTIELRTERQEDTNDYLDTILKGLNWIFQVINGTMDLLNEKETIVDKSQINSDVMEINQFYEKKADVELANVLEMKILPLLERLNKTAVELTGIQES